MLIRFLEIFEHVSKFAVPNLSLEREKTFFIFEINNVKNILPLRVHLWLYFLENLLHGFSKNKVLRKFFKKFSQKNKINHFYEF